MQNTSSFGALLPLRRRALFLSNKQFFAFCVKHDSVALPHNTENGADANNVPETNLWCIARQIVQCARQRIEYLYSQLLSQSLSHDARRTRENNLSESAAVTDDKKRREEEQWEQEENELKETKHEVRQLIERSNSSSKERWKQHNLSELQESTLQCDKGVDELDDSNSSNEFMWLDKNDYHKNVLQILSLLSIAVSDENSLNKRFVAWDEAITEMLWLLEQYEAERTCNNENNVTKMLELTQLHTIQETLRQFIVLFYSAGQEFSEQLRRESRSSNSYNAYSSNNDSGVNGDKEAPNNCETMERWHKETAEQQCEDKIADSGNYYNRNDCSCGVGEKETPLTKKTCRVELPADTTGSSIFHCNHKTAKHEKDTKISPHSITDNANKTSHDRTGITHARFTWSVGGVLSSTLYQIMRESERGVFVEEQYKSPKIK